jgi:prophage regulatory protein
MMTTAATRADNILRQPEVMARTGLKRTTLYKKIGNGTFPAQIRLSENCVGWYESAVNDWVANPR